MEGHDVCKCVVVMVVWVKLCCVVVYKGVVRTGTMAGRK